MVVAPLYRTVVEPLADDVRDAALAVGASRVQTVFHHVLPLALPGILTGTIIGMARALGETAPLLMIGMRAFVASPPEGFTSPATVLPVQIFLWSDEVSKGFVEKTSAAIIVYGLCFKWLLNPETYTMISLGIFLFIGMILMGFIFGPMSAILPELFPSRVRYTGSGTHADNINWVIGEGSRVNADVDAD